MSAWERTLGAAAPSRNHDPELGGDDLTVSEQLQLGDDR
jgi:hypothetical protein